MGEDTLISILLPGNPIPVIFGQILDCNSDARHFSGSQFRVGGIPSARDRYPVHNGNWLMRLMFPVSVTSGKIQRSEFRIGKLDGSSLFWLPASGSWKELYPGKKAVSYRGGDCGQLFSFRLKLL